MKCAVGFLFFGPGLARRPVGKGATKGLKSSLVTWISENWWKSTSNFAPGQGARRKEYRWYFDDEKRSTGVKGPSNIARFFWDR